MGSDRPGFLDIRKGAGLEGGCLVEHRIGEWDLVSLGPWSAEGSFLESRYAN